jgi:hypothetical protein
MLDPQIAPMVAAAAINPNSLLPCSELNTSTTRAQNTDTTNKLKIEIQTKNARPTHTLCAGSVKCRMMANSRIFAAKNR